MNQIKKSHTDEVGKRSYANFGHLNGEHPFKKNVPAGRVEYKARYRKGGKVAFFNFDLAKEMGLIAKSHPHSITPDLEKEILETFSLTIINEYDVMNKVKIPEEDIFPNTFMATFLPIIYPTTCFFDFGVNSKIKAFLL